MSTSTMENRSSFNSWVSRSCLIVCAFVLSPFNQAHASDYAGEGAPTIAKGRVEVGALSSAKWGLTNRIELGAHPVGIFLLPTVRGKILWWQGGSPSKGHDASYWFSTLHRVSVPTPFLHLFAREGSLGLLPANADIPFAVQLENSAIFSLSLRGHIASAQAGVGVAAAEKSDLPMIEFPFIYTTLAPLYSPITLRWALSLEGKIAGPFEYQVIQRMNLWKPRKDLAWPSEDGAPWVYAQESALRAHWLLGKRHRISAGATVSIAHYPIGYRLYVLPTIDYRAVLF